MFSHFHQSLPVFMLVVLSVQCTVMFILLLIDVFLATDCVQCGSKLPLNFFFHFFI